MDVGDHIDISVIKNKAETVWLVMDILSHRRSQNYKIENNFTKNKNKKGVMYVFSNN